jgi:hypothetical protein
VRGERGQRRFLERRIDTLPWFADFRRSQHNFARGLSRISDDVVVEFERLMRKEDRRRNA